MPRFKKPFSDLQIQEVDEWFLIHISKKGYCILPSEWTESSSFPFLPHNILPHGLFKGAEIRIWFLHNIANRVHSISQHISAERFKSLASEIVEFRARQWGLSTDEKEN